MVFILSTLWWIRIKGLWKLPDARDWLWGKLDLVLMSGAMLSKSLIRLSIDGWGCVPSLLFGLRPNYCRGNNINGDLLQKDLLVLLYSVPLTPQQATVDPHLCRRLLDTLTGKSGSVSCGDTAPFSWLLVHTRFYLCPPRVCFPSPVEVLSSNPTGFQNQLS